MKKLLRLKTMLLLCALIAGSGSVWAADVEDALTVKSWASYSGSCETNGTDHEGTSSTTSVKYIMQAYSGSSGQVRGNQSNAYANFSCRNSTTYSGYYIKEIKLVVTGGTLDGGTANRSVVYFGTSAFENPKDNTPSGTPVSSNENASGKTTLTWSNTDKTATYFILYNLKTSGTTANSVVTVTWAKQATAALESISVDATGAQKIFHQGDTFSHEGVVVTATYDDSETKDVTDKASFSTPDMSTTGTKTITVSYTENEVTETDTYDITVNAPAVLTGISLSGTYTTTFTQGGEFNHEGLIVTASYNDETSKVVTGDAVVSTPDLTTAGTKTVTVSYTENGVDKTATYDITVNEYIQKTNIDISLYNSFFGSTGTSNVTDETLSGTQDNIKVTINKNDGNKLYVNSSQIRLYNKNTIVVKVQTPGYVLTSVQFVEPSSGTAWAGSHTSSPTGYDSGTKTWTGAADEVTITFAGTCRIAGINVKLAKFSTVTLAAACTDGSKYYGTYSNAKAFVVPADLTVSTVEVTDGVLAVTDYSTGDVVKAGTGVMVSSTTAGEHTVLLSEETGEELDGNMLKASSVDMTGSNKFYRLTMHNGDTIGFWWGAENGAAFTIAANKAYLAVPETLAREGFAFDFGDATNIRSIGNEQLNNDNVYNLAGQRVAQPTKGLYIVNGKKIVIR